MFVCFFCFFLLHERTGYTQLHSFCLFVGVFFFFSFLLCFVVYFWARRGKAFQRFNIITKVTRSTKSDGDG